MTLLPALGPLAVVFSAPDQRGNRPVAAAVPAARPAHADIPAGYVARYREAAKRYLLDWHVLAAVGKLETGHGRWLFDGDTDGRADVYDPDDAIPAMASYLRASGAPEDWRGALLAYNRSPRYVDQVLQLADRYRSWRGR